MILALDTSELKKVRIRLDAGRKIIRREYASYADAAFAKIIKLLAGRRPSSIAVVAGPGAWSATRTGVALANALAYGLGVKIAAIDRSDFDSDDALPRGTRGQVAVRYDAPPNITKKKA